MLGESDWWVAPSWACYWVMEFLLPNISHPDTVATLHEIYDNNLPNFRIAELPESQRTEVYELLATRLVPDAAERIQTKGRYVKAISSSSGPWANAHGRTCRPPDPHRTDPPSGWNRSVLPRVQPHKSPSATDACH